MDEYSCVAFIMPRHMYKFLEAFGRYLLHDFIFTNYFRDTVYSILLKTIITLLFSDSTIEKVLVFLPLSYSVVSAQYVIVSNPHVVLQYYGSDFTTTGWLDVNPT